MADEDELGNDESGGNKTNLSNLSASKKSTGTGHLTFESAKRGGGNVKKGVEAGRDSDYLNPVAKKAFNHLRHTFTQATIF